jgi:predicted small secreted protein
MHLSCPQGGIVYTRPRVDPYLKFRKSGRFTFVVNDSWRSVSMFKRLIAISLLMSGLVALAGCNTVAGAGKDLTDSANAVKHAM